MFGRILFQPLFDAFGKSALGQIAASMTIGAALGLLMPDAELRWWCAGGGAAVGLIAASYLTIADRRRRRVKTRQEAPLPRWVGPLVAVCFILMLLVGII